MMYLKYALRGDNLKYLNRDEIRQLDATKLLLYVNRYLNNGGTMNQFEKKHHVTKKYIKNKLNELNVGYNQATKQYESLLDLVVIENEELNTNTIEKDDIELLSDEQNQATSNDNSHEVVNLLSDIKALLEVNNLRLGTISEDLTTIAHHDNALISVSANQFNKTAIIDNIRPLRTDEDLITRNVKIYPTIMKRLKRLVDDSDYQQQQVLSALLDEVLTKYGY